MTRACSPRSIRRPRSGIRGALVCLLVLLAAAAAVARPAAELREERTIRPDGIHVLDGSYVLDMGELHVNITNHGLIGSQFTETLPYSQAPSGEWPGGTGHEYLWGAGLWVGGKINGQLAVTTGQPERELRPARDIAATIYEARGGKVRRPTASEAVRGMRLPDLRADDDGDGRVDEDPLNGHDDDGDGEIDEDFGQVAEQMFTCTMHDNIPLVQELYPDHLPLGLTVVQRAGAWYQDEFEDIVVLEWEITNTGVDHVADVYVGFYVDCDIQRRSEGSEPDDLAGFYSGAARADDGTFHRLEVGWMRDADPVDPLPGWFGAVLLGHDTDFMEHYAPRRVGVRTFQIFATNALVIQDGEPLTDADRYAVMSARRSDPDRRPDLSGDLKFLMSWGPFGSLPPGRTITSRVALVMGSSKEEMLANALKASVIHRGRAFDMDDNRWTGASGREKLVCLGDYPTYPNGADPLFDYRYAFADEFCSGSDPVFGAEVINKEAMFSGPDGRKCIYVNADNCEECFRAYGVECTEANGLFWRFRDEFPASFWSSSSNNRFYTGVGGREFDVPWVFPGEFPPRSPTLRLMPGDSRVELFWDDASEHDPDQVTGMLDFESYRVYRVADWRRPPGTSDQSGPETGAWGLLGEFDIINEVAGGHPVGSRMVPLGANTGLDPIAYEPRCLADPRFEGLAEIMQAYVAADTEGRLAEMPTLRDSRGRVVEGLESFIRWETWPTVLDTFFAVTPRAAADSTEVPKRAVRYYHYVDDTVHNGFDVYYSIVPTDHLVSWNETTESYELAGKGVQSDPGNNYQSTRVGPQSQTAAEREAEGVNIYVYPNPATREALAEMQQQPRSHDDPTGVRVIFNNLPQAHNLISIFTASGDLVETIPHDGTRDVGAASWNLVSRNGQEVVSGVYLYTVESDDDRFDVFRGRFVVVR